MCAMHYHPFLNNACRFRLVRVTDRRVKVMNEVISGIRVLKMYGWEYAFSRLIAKIRRYRTRRFIGEELILAIGEFSENSPVYSTWDGQ